MVARKVLIERATRADRHWRDAQLAARLAAVARVAYMRALVADGMTYTEVGAVFGVTKSRVSDLVSGRGAK